MIRTTLATLVLAGAVAAQSDGPPPLVGVTGVLQPAGPAICAAGATHKLECTDVYLTDLSVTGVLGNLVGQNVKVFGHQITDTPGCIVIDVESIQNPPPSELIFCGTPALGCPFRVKVCPPGLSQFWLFAALDNGYKPLHPTRGTWLLGDPFYLLAAGFMDIACAQFDLVIPQDPALIGVNVWMQSARKEFSVNAPAQLGNAICFEILPPVVPCVQPDC